MTVLEFAAITAAGLSVIAGPTTNPRNATVKLQTCRRHPGLRFAMSCAGCAQDLYDTEAANRAQAAANADKFSKLVRDALGLPGYPMPDTDGGETTNKVSLWSVRELNAVYERVGGTVTAREVSRNNGCGEWYTETELKIEVNLPGVGWVYAFTGWDPAEETYSLTLPVVLALNVAAAAV